METNKKEFMGKILIVSFFVLVIITLIGFFTSMQAGKIGLIQNIMKWGGLAVVSIYLEILMITSIIKLGKNDRKSIMVVIILAIICIIGSFFSLQTIKALGAEKEVIRCSDYEVKYNVVIGSVDKCRLIIKKDNDSVVTIDITEEMYDELSQGKRHGCHLHS